MIEQSHIVVERDEQSIKVRFTMKVTDGNGKEDHYRRLSNRHALELANALIDEVIAYNREHGE